MIEIEKLSKRFGKTQALQSVDLHLREGQSVAFIGPNGSGKTTLIKCILGLVHPDQGHIRVRGALTAGRYRYRRHIGYMPQVGRYPDQMTVDQVLGLIRQVRRPAGAAPLDEELIHDFGLDRFRHKRMHTLSSGMRQKVGAALAFLFDPPILILDEPTAGLDPLSNELLKDKIRRQRERGKLILTTSHILSDLDDITSDVLFIQDGRIVFFKSIESLKKETDETRLSRAIAYIMKKGAANG